MTNKIACLSTPNNNNSHCVRVQ